MPTAQDHRLVAALRAAARELTGHRSIHDLEQTLGQIVASAVETIPGVDAGSISITEHGRIETRHPTRQSVRKLDETQSELDEGPCITAIEDPPDDGMVVAHDLTGADAGRWPRYAPIVVGVGFQALTSIQLSTDGGMHGALNLYSEAPNALDEHALTLAGLFGLQAALLLYGTEQARHLQRAVDSRDLIGRAKGILMERFKVDDHGAFRMLVKSSQDTNIKVTDVAQWLNDNVTSSAHQRTHPPGTF
ncbi:ANTAR domain-containing response regulator [Actinomycetospora sp. TBRC 11914]|uniref:ANTAR domain-containing response regulator n=1 Tax=Actinomycetospora sp. TBRC 11914 TaxID=2729387 RepID=UPI00145DCCDE|nr:GAF and ANTAR domain-containing protein [Actinomycetospora sp. TBRC 11914]NMO90594.1 ANTAR domain-containing protein [Actinomycetospora sp. TBRC 11914]